MLEDSKKLEYRKRIGQGLAVAREELDLTQMGVVKTGIVRSNRLSQIELGKVSITTEEFLALCDLYKTTPDVVPNNNPNTTPIICQRTSDAEWNCNRKTTQTG